MNRALLSNLYARDYALAIVALSGGLVFVALVLEHTVEGMTPCPLCLMQRLWFLIAGLLAYAGVAHNPRWGIYPLLTLLSTLVGGAFAIRQLWLMSLPADRVPACMDFGRLLEYGNLSQILGAMTSGTGDCAAEPPLLGIPVPAWSLAGFAAVALLAILQWRANR